MVGSAMARDLARDHQVYVADLNQAALAKVKKHEPGINTEIMNVLDGNALKKWLEPADLVLCAVPGNLGYQTLINVIDAGKNIVDISFMPENTLDLFQRAQEQNITVIFDAGVAPGIPNYLLGYHDSISKVEKFEYRVGGLPQNPHPPYNYKAPFSPRDVLEEYTRPARMVIDGQPVTRPALSDLELVTIDPVGELQAFNTDGLRSLLSTMSHIPHLQEKTLRYPGHGELMQIFVHSGFLNSEPLQFKGHNMAAIDLTSELLFKEWHLEDDEPEFTIMDIFIESRAGKQKQVVKYLLYDEYDRENKVSSMARTTGYTATATVNLILEGLFKTKGVFPPEQVGCHKKNLDFILNYLAQRNIKLEKSEPHIL